MNNEIGRKLTSLTLMTIMLASAFSAFAPSAMPQAAAANANLYVSAENSQFQNYFAGPQVIEVVVIDSDIKDTNVGKGEPSVTINGNQLRMVQATDGNWYGYFADRAQAQLADSTAQGAGIGTSNRTGTDFGEFCKSDTTVFGVTFSQTTGIAVATNVTGGVNGQGTLATCTFASSGATAASIAASQTHAQDLNNVVRENKTINRGVSGKIGQIGLTSRAADQAWPFIQLYDFTAGGNVVVQYNKGGGVQKTTLTFDKIPKQLVGLSLDRASYPQDSQVHVTMTDPQLNIDPTDEDSWTFGTNPINATIFYQLFDSNGIRQGDGKVSNALTGNLTGLMFDKNGVLKLAGNAQSSTGTNVVLIQDNADSVVSTTNDLSTAADSSVTSGSQPVTFTEQGPNTGVFGTYDEQDASVLKVTSTALRGTSASLSYNDKSNSIVVANYFGTITFDKAAIGSEWNSGEQIGVSLVDGDQNLNTRNNEDLKVYSKNSTIPAIKIGKPLTLANSPSTTTSVKLGVNGGVASATVTTGATDTYSDRAKVAVTAAQAAAKLLYLNVTTSYTMNDLSDFVRNGSSVNGGNGNSLFNYFQYDVRSIGTGLTGGATLQSIYIGNATVPKALVFNSTTSPNGFAASSLQGIIDMGKVHYTERLHGAAIANLTDSAIGGTGRVIITFVIKPTTSGAVLPADTYPITADLTRFGISNNGQSSSDRFNDAIYRLELEETGDNTATFAGTLEYIMLNQLNVNNTNTYKAIVPTSNKVTMIVGEDLTGKDSVRANYLDLGADGVATQIADQVEAPTHSGTVALDSRTYKVGDTVTITLKDQDLNTNTDLIDIYTVVSAGNDKAFDTVGAAGYGVDAQSALRGRLLEVKFGGERWLASGQTGTGTSTCTATPTGSNGLGNSGFTLVEQGSATGIFQGSFQIPNTYCARGTNTGAGTGTITSTQGAKIEIKYLDFRDASGTVIETGDSATVRSNTGSVSLDRTVYPVPWGELADLTTGATGAASPNSKSVFPVHKTALGTNVNSATKTLGNGDLILHIQVNDPDSNTSASGEDTINFGGGADGTDTVHGPVKVVISRGASSVLLATAGAATATGSNGKITIGDSIVTTGYVTKELGPIIETAPDSGIFEFNLPVKFTDGPASTTCPTVTTTTKYVSANNETRFSAEPRARFGVTSTDTSRFCILQGDIVTVTYRDPADSSGKPNTVTDSATFDLRNGALQSDKSVYIIGSDMILTLIEPDFDRDNQNAETYSLDLIDWDSNAKEVTMGNLGGETAAFDPEPSNLRETGDSTGIFQSVVKIPQTLGNKVLQRGEEVVLEYNDWGPSGASYVGEESQDINLTVFTSNFGASVELDQKVYTWTDRVYITVIAPDHNFDSNTIDTIGNTADNPVKVATRSHKLSNYHLVESGVDTGIFTGEVILTGFSHNADGDANTGTNGNDAPDFTGSSPGSTTTDLGPTNGFLQAADNDGLTVSFEFSKSETVVGSALIRWNIGEVSWLEASYPASGTGVVRVIDPDMNIHPKAVDNIKVSVWSDSDSGGISLTATETNEASGIFEGTVYFTTTDASSGHRLRVAEGDTVTAEYKDNTLPAPYTKADELDITGTSFIGTVVPPLERAPASNARVVDAFGNALNSVSVDQQVQITADLVNGQDRVQPFAYLVQVQDGNGVTVSLAWITGSLSAGQSFSPALSWIPSASGTYTATVFVWESVDNPTALSPPVSVDITVS